MSLSKQQMDFVQAVGKLINFVYSKGYTLTFGDTYPGKFKHRKDSWHGKGLAIDLNLFLNGEYLTKTSDHAQFGEFWESIGGTWGGRWKDGNHYSWGEGGK